MDMSLVEPDIDNRELAKGRLHEQGNDKQPDQ